MLIQRVATELGARVCDLVRLDATAQLLQAVGDRHTRAAIAAQILRCIIAKNAPLSIADSTLAQHVGD